MTVTFSHLKLFSHLLNIFIYNSYPANSSCRCAGWNCFFLKLLSLFSFQFIQCKYALFILDTCLTFRWNWIFVRDWYDVPKSVNITLLDSNYGIFNSEGIVEHVELYIGMSFYRSFWLVWARPLFNPYPMLGGLCCYVAMFGGKPWSLQGRRTHTLSLANFSIPMVLDSMMGTSVALIHRRAIGLYIWSLVIPMSKIVI